mgnify:CR=1 FL=1
MLSQALRSGFVPSRSAPQLLTRASDAQAELSPSREIGSAAARKEEAVLERRALQLFSALRRPTPAADGLFASAPTGSEGSAWEHAAPPSPREELHADETSGGRGSMDAEEDRGSSSDWVLAAGGESAGDEASEQDGGGSPGRALDAAETWEILQNDWARLGAAVAARALSANEVTVPLLVTPRGEMQGPREPGSPACAFRPGLTRGRGAEAGRGSGAGSAAAG